jgi:nucleoside-diphosphate-sugar epimerase
MNQTFKNYYESTKYEAEVLVRSLIPEVPTTIIRPGIVKGHSQTGETTKFDGPYMMLNFFDKLKFSPLIPFLGGKQAVGNFVPVDYILDATLYLGHSDKGIGKTYHLTDPHAYSMKEVYAMLMQEFLNRKPIGTIPLPLVKAAMSLSFIRKWLQVEKEALDYFIYEVIYDCTQAQTDLQDSEIKLPDFKDTLKPMVQFYREHKHDLTKHIKIR